METLCKYLDIPFSEKAFMWKKYDQEFHGHDAWNEQKVGDHIHHWHGRAIQSMEMGKPSSYNTNQDGTPSFTEIDDETHRKDMIGVYQENLIYYKKFINATENHLISLGRDNGGKK